MCSETPNTPKCKQLASKTNRVSIMVPTCCILGCMWIHSCNPKLS